MRARLGKDGRTCGKTNFRSTDRGRRIVLRAHEYNDVSAPPIGTYSLFLIFTICHYRHNRMTV